MPRCLLFGLIVLFSPLAVFASFESDVITVTNEGRASVNAPTLTENTQLSAIAAARAARMAETQNFSHTDVDGHNAWYWLKEGGYLFSRAGENIAVNFNDAGSAVKQWMNSEGHRANILNAQFKEIGVGTAEGMYKGATSTYIVQLFGTPVEEREQRIVGSEQRIENGKQKTENSEPKNENAIAPATSPAPKQNPRLAQTAAIGEVQKSTTTALQPSTAIQAVSLAGEYVEPKATHRLISILTSFFLTLRSLF